MNITGHQSGLITHPGLTTNIGMPNLGQELHLGRFKWVGCGDDNVNLENSPIIDRALWPFDLAE